MITHASCASQALQFGAGAEQHLQSAQGQQQQQQQAAQRHSDQQAFFVHLEQQRQQQCAFCQSSRCNCGCSGGGGEPEAMHGGESCKSSQSSGKANQANQTNQARLQHSSPASSSSRISPAPNVAPGCSDMERRVPLAASNIYHETQLFEEQNQNHQELYGSAGGQMSYAQQQQQQQQTIESDWVMMASQADSRLAPASPGVDGQAYARGQPQQQLGREQRATNGKLEANRNDLNNNNNQLQQSQRHQSQGKSEQPSFASLVPLVSVAEEQQQRQSVFAYQQHCDGGGGGAEVGHMLDAAQYYACERAPMIEYFPLINANNESSPNNNNNYNTGEVLSGDSPSSSTSPNASASSATCRRPTQHHHHHSHHQHHHEQQQQQQAPAYSHSNFQYQNFYHTEVQTFQDHYHYQQERSSFVEDYGQQQQQQQQYRVPEHTAAFHSAGGQNYESVGEPQMLTYHADHRLSQVSTTTTSTTSTTSNSSSNSNQGAPQLALGAEKAACGIQRDKQQGALETLAHGARRNNKCSSATSAATNRRGRPRKKGANYKGKVSGKLWEFIRDLLLNERTNPSFIRWERLEDGVFKFVQSDKVAKMWGERKQNPKMTYEKLSRAMRYYYKSKVLLPVFGRRLVYKFGPNATGWMPAVGASDCQLTTNRNQPVISNYNCESQQQRQQHPQHTVVAGGHLVLADAETASGFGH